MSMAHFDASDLSFRRYSTARMGGGRGALRTVVVAATVLGGFVDLERTAAQTNGSALSAARGQWSPNRYLPGARRPDSIGAQRLAPHATDPRVTVPISAPSSGASLTAAEEYLGPAGPAVGTSPGTPRGVLSDRPWDDEVFFEHDLKDWTPQWLPDGIIYRSYLAGVKEPRLATTFDDDGNLGGLWEFTLGGRVGIFRFGTDDPIRPEGFQLDLEGAGMPRLRLDSDRDLQAVDFRGGFPLTYGIGPWATKLAYYHLSSHAGDEFLVKNPAFQRVNYSRDAFVLGQSYYLTPALRLYGEAGWAFYSDVSEPWEFQFGAEFSPLCPTGIRGAPFAAINGQLREEVDFGGNVVVQAGWQWRSARNGQLLRMGMQYYNGKSNQFEFYNQNENKLGLGVWYDY
jgi:hypothetical protein